MSWLQLHLHSDPERAEAIEDALLATGAASVTFQDRADQPILEPALGEAPLWQQTRITGLFDAAVDTAGVVRAIDELLPFPLPEHRWEQLEDRDWQREWMRDYQPIHCGEGLWIVPSWLEAPAEADTVLRLDPGLAFGTGTHPTTLLCLQWLAKQDLQGVTVIDYGCGSGILGIAALLRGASRLLALDIDPQALTATRENCERNGIAAERLSLHLPGQLPDIRAALGLATILAGPLVELAPTRSELTAAGGRLCLAGLLESQASAVAAAYGERFHFDPIEQRDEWVRLTARARD